MGWDRVMKLRLFAAVIALTAVFGTSVPFAIAQEAAPAPDPAEGAPARESSSDEKAANGNGDTDAGENAAGAAEGNLDSRQENIARRFRQFEKTLLQMGEYMRKTEPERADLLFRARSRGQEVRVAQQMDQIIALLKKEQFGDAIERQAELVKHLREMLELLQSEDRRSELDKEKERIQNLLKELNKNIASQKDVRAQTERGGEPGELSEKQKNVTESTRKLGQKIDQQDAEQSGSPKDAGSGDSRSGENKDGEKKDGENQPQDEDGSQQGKEDPKSDRESKESKDPQDAKEPRSDDSKSGKPGKKESQSGKQGKPSGDSKDQKPQSGEPQQGEPQDGGEPQSGDQGDQQQSPKQSQSSPEQKQKKTPGREEIEQARKEMEQAIEKLKKLNADAASGHQDEAVRKLQEAKEKLEEILRQLREEERELMLAALEARFQKMLALQIAVHNGTTSLDKTPKTEWTARHFGSARSLANDEDAIALEAAKALTLLKEEGSSVAFPEGVEQVRDDMLSVARLLERTEVGEFTQGVQRDIIEALEEMIEALQKEMEKSKNKDKQQGSGEGQQQEQDKALVDEIAELKMLRSLQLRINRRTKRLGSLVKGEQATEAEVVEQLQTLSRRQSQVQQATHDLATGKNK